MKDHGSNRQVTLIDVAREAGVSRATASLVIRQSPLVSKSTRESVEAAIEKLGYVRNLTAARLRSVQSRLIGLIVPNLSNPFFAEFLAGVEAVLDQHHLAVLMANSQDDCGRQTDLMRRMREHGVDGVIICPAAETPNDWDEGRSFGSMPAVQTLRHVTRNLDYVGVDYQQGVRLAVDHLVKLGHRAINLAVQGAEHSAYRERVASYKSAISSHGLDGKAIFRIPGSIAEIPGCASELMKCYPASTATLCFNDITAFGLSAGFYDLGVALGRDHSLIGFDDVLNGEARRPKLTSVATHPELIGRAAASRMIARLKEPSLPANSQILPADLVVRQTCGPAPATPSR